MIRECPICISEFTEGDMLIMLPCHSKHCFHEKCIVNWISKSKAECPLCKRVISEEMIEKYYENNLRS